MTVDELLIKVAEARGYAEGGDIEFVDKATGKYGKVERWSDNSLWLFWKHPDGQWVSWRKATDMDCRRLMEAIL